MDMCMCMDMRMDMCTHVHIHMCMHMSLHISSAQELLTDGRESPTMSPEEYRHAALASNSAGSQSSKRASGQSFDEWFAKQSPDEQAAATAVHLALL